MTTRPTLRDTGELLPAVAAVGLFVVMAAVFLGAPIGDAAGFPQTAEVANESIGDASVASNAAITSNENGTFAKVRTGSGNESTLLSENTDANASIVTTGGGTYGVVTEPVSVTETIGYAMFGLSDQLPAELNSESFLAVFEIIDLVLVAALVGAIVLARREEVGTVVALFAPTEDAAPGGAVAADGGSDAADARDEQSDGGDA
jgi:hypothetical protein